MGNQTINVYAGDTITLVGAAGQAPETPDGDPSAEGAAPDPSTVVSSDTGDVTGVGADPEADPAANDEPADDAAGTPEPDPAG